MSVTPETVAKDTAAIRERVLGLHHVLAHSTKLSVMECIWLWKVRGSLDCKGPLTVAGRPRIAEHPEEGHQSLRSATDIDSRRE